MIKCKHCGRTLKHAAAYNDHLWAKHPETKLPKYRALLEKEARLEQAYAEAGDLSTGLDDEGSAAYFERYIAGDRK